MLGNIRKILQRDRRYEENLLYFSLTSITLFSVIAHIYVFQTLPWWNTLDEMVAWGMIYLPSFFVTFSLLIAYITHPLPAIALMILVLLPLLYNRMWRVGFEILASIASAGIAGTLLKYAYSIERPVPTHLLETGYSFPSLHAVISWTFALSVILWLNEKGTFRRSTKSYSLLMSAGLILSAFVISLSRVAIGVHRGTDIIAGALLGISVSTLCFVLTRRYYN